MKAREQEAVVIDRWVSRRTGKPTAEFGNHQRKRYLVEYRDPDTGKAVREAFAHQASAQERARVLNEQVRTKGTVVSPAGSRTTFKAWAEEYYANRRDLAPATQSRARTYRNRHYYPYFGDVPMSRLSTEDIERAVTAWNAMVIDRRTGEPRRCQSENTQTSLMRELNAILNAAVKRNRIPRNPADGVVLPKVPEKRRVLLTLDEIKAMAEAVKPLYRLLFVLGANSGMRISEMLGLAHDDITYTDSGATIVISRQLKDEWKPGQPLWEHVKTRNSRRVIKVGPDVAQAIREHRTRFGDGPMGLVFRSSRSPHLPLKRSTTDYVWDTACRRGLGRELDGGWHHLRYWVASALRESGRSSKAAAAMLGNTPKVLEETYALTWHDAESENQAAVSAAWNQPSAHYLLHPPTHLRAVK